MAGGGGTGKQFGVFGVDAVVDTALELGCSIVDVVVVDSAYFVGEHRFDIGFRGLVKARHFVVGLVGNFVGDWWLCERMVLCHCLVGCSVGCGVGCGVGIRM